MLKYGTATLMKGQAQRNKSINLVTKIVMNNCQRRYIFNPLLRSEK